MRNLPMFDQAENPSYARHGLRDFAKVALKGPIPGRQAGHNRLKNGTDTDWVALVRRIADAQDTTAFTQVFEHFAPRVKAYLMRSGTDATMAEECAQDVMATVWQKAAQFDPSKASVATWVYTIARNRRIDMLRRDRRPEPEELPWGPEDEPDQFDAMALQQDTDRLAEALKALPDKQRQMIESAYFGDLTHNEIADATGLPLGTIKSRIRLGLERLRHAMS